MQGSITESLSRELTEEHFSDLVHGYIQSLSLAPTAFNAMGQLSLTFAGTIAAYIARKDGLPWPIACAQMPSTAFSDKATAFELLCVNGDRDAADGGCLVWSEADESLLYCSTIPLIDDPHASFSVGISLFAARAIAWEARIRSQLPVATRRHYING